VFGTIGKGQRMRIVSRMPEGGVVFSDGVLEDALTFTSGSVAEVVVSDRKANLIAALGVWAIFAHLLWLDCCKGPRAADGRGDACVPAAQADDPGRRTGTSS